MSFFLHFFHPSKKTRASATSKKEKEKKKTWEAPFFISFLPIMAPTVKRIMTQPIVSTRCAIHRSLQRHREDAGIAFVFFFPFLLHIDDGDLTISIHLSSLSLSLFHTHTRIKTELDLPLPPVAADGADLAVRAGRFADRRVDYRACFCFFFFFISHRRSKGGGRGNVFFFFFRPPLSLSLSLWTSLARSPSLSGPRSLALPLSVPPSPSTAIARFSLPPSSLTQSRHKFPLNLKKTLRKKKHIRALTST